MQFISSPIPPCVIQYIYIHIMITLYQTCHLFIFYTIHLPSKMHYITYYQPTLLPTCLIAFMCKIKQNAPQPPGENQGKWAGLLMRTRQLFYTDGWDNTTETYKTMMKSWHGNCFKLLALCEGNPPVTGGFPSQRVSNAEFWCFLCCQSEFVDQVVGFLMIWAVMTSLWCHCNDFVRGIMQPPFFKYAQITILILNVVKQ